SGFDGATVPICTFTFCNQHLKNYQSSFVRLSAFKGADAQAPKTLEAIKDHKCGWFYIARPDDFNRIPGSPIAYWLSDAFRLVFERSVPLSALCELQPGLQTTDNALFVRLWHEVPLHRIGFGCGSNQEAVHSGRKWFPYNKGGD